MIRHILVVGPSTKGLKGGQATHMENMEQAFLSSEEVKLKFFQSSSGLENTEPVLKKIIRLFITIFSFPFYLKGTDCIHVNTSFDNKAIIRDLFILSWACLFRKKIVIQYHGGNPFDLFIFKNLVIKKIYFSIWKNCEILVLNDEQELWFENIDCINKIKIKNYVKLPDISLKKVGGYFRFIYLGRIIKEKGLLNIVEAAKEIASEYDFVVDIYGVGEDSKLIQEYIEALEIGDVVKLRGPVDVIEKNKKLASSNCFLYPTYYPEGLPYAVLEALSYALPVICTDAGALKTVVTDNVTCLKVNEKSTEDLMEKMKVIMLDKHLTSKISRNSRNMIESDYSIDAMRKLFINLWCHNEII